MSRTIRVAIQGERGSFSEQAAIKLVGPKASLLSCASFDDLFSAVRKGRADIGVVPIENTLAGSIHKNYDLLLESGLQITAETNVRIEHCLIGTRKATRKKIHTVLSHPVALDQCRRFLRRNPRIKPIETYDTAGAVQHIVEDGDPGIAAIAGIAAAKHFGGKVLIKNIEDNPENFTRFFAVERGARRKAAKSGSGESKSVKTSLVFIAKNVPGALFRCLSVFALRDINLCKIESRPLPGKPWEYLFYVDLLAATRESRTRNALRHLEEITDFLKVLGCYPVKN
ncbi:MAG TPA: prephenate dehydratase [Acidobacteriota bacterium]